MADTNSTCGSCMFYFPLEFMGHCKRFPKYEQKAKGEWCGEFYPKDAFLKLQIEEQKEVTAAGQAGGEVPQITDGAVVEQPKRRGRPPKEAK